MIKDGISRTSRLLTLYHLFEHCREVSIYEMVPKVSEQTFFDDVQLLKDAGVIIADYDEKEKSFYPDWDMQDAPLEPNLPEDETQRAYIEKIRRLCILMNKLEDFYMYEEMFPIGEYQTLFPDASDETREEDFAELAKIGYTHTRHIGKDDEGNKTWLYEFNATTEAYELKTIEEMKTKP